ncbi:MAG: beta-mannanase [Actinobacteria bacterium]|nr:beta-mannanase [Actinomycetota bacterium]
MKAVHDLEQSIGRRLDLVHIYKAWAETWGQYSDQTIRELTLASANNRRPLITWEPWAHSQGVNQPNFSLASIATGKHDPYIRSWAHGLRDFPSTVYLRPMHEMNSNWYPWAGAVNENNFTDYIAAWRHMHAIFDQVGANNVRWVWSPYALDVPTGNRFEAYYPGIEYVDILAFDAYNWGSGDSHSPERSGTQWQNVDELLSVPYERLIKLGRQPVWLTEVGSAEQGGDKASWLRMLLQSRSYDRISAVVWFHANKERDWRITSSVSVTTTVAQAIAGTQPAIEAEVAAAPGPITDRRSLPER